MLEVARFFATFARSWAAHDYDNKTKPILFPILR